MADRPILLQGNEAVAEGAIAAGARFFGGYPITPSTEIAETLARRLPEVGGTFMQMEDEIASIAAVCGASLAGQKALTATSGPGFSLMQEMIGFAAMAQIPCVVVDVMRGGPSTGLPTDPAQGDVMQARWGTHGEHSVIALVPSSVLECYTLTVDAFNLSEQYRTPVVILSDALVGHMREAVTLPDPGTLRIAERGEPDCEPDEYDTVVSELDKILPRPALGSSFRVHVTGLVYNRRSGTAETGDPRIASDLGRYLREKIYHHRAAIAKVEEYMMDEAEVAIFAYGSVARSARAVVKWGRAWRARRPGATDHPVAVPDARRRSHGRPGEDSHRARDEHQADELGGASCRRGPCKVVDYGRVDGRLITPAEIEGLLKKEFYYHSWGRRHDRHRRRGAAGGRARRRVQTAADHSAHHQRDQAVAEDAEDDLVPGVLQRHHYSGAHRRHPQPRSRSREGLLGCGHRLLGAHQPVPRVLDGACGPRACASGGDRRQARRPLPPRDRCHG
jgi:2-oxoglutarate ferredoxin oxidoreductase subunit alpha